MTVAFGSGLVVVGSAWTAFKTPLNSKTLALQYDNDGVIYTIYALDGSIVYTCVIWIGAVPDGVIAGGYSQSQNDADKADFEANYQPYANRRVLASAPTPSVLIGYTTTTDTSFTAIRASAYTEQSTNAQRSLVSSSASDTSAGTGARTILLTYYDQTLAGPYTETITLNGTSSVNTVATNICFIESMFVATVGSAGGNVGTISLKSTTGGGGTTVGSIVASDNQTQWCHHYVGTNRTVRISDYAGSIKGSVSGAVHLRKATPTVANTPEYTIGPVLRVPAGEMTLSRLSASIQVSGPARITLYAKADATATQDWQGVIGYYEV